MSKVGVKAGRLSRTQGQEQERKQRYPVAHRITRSLVRVSLPTPVVFWCSDHKDHVISKVSDSAPACAHIRGLIIHSRFQTKAASLKSPAPKTTATNIYSIRKWPALRLGLYFEMVFDQSL